MYRLKKILKKAIALFTTPRVGNLIKLCIINKMYYEGEITLKTKFDRLKEGEINDYYKLHN